MCTMMWLIELFTKNRGIILPYQMGGVFCWFHRINNCDGRLVTVTGSCSIIVYCIRNCYCYDFSSSCWSTRLPGNKIKHIFAKLQKCLSKYENVKLFWELMNLDWLRGIRCLWLLRINSWVFEWILFFFAMLSSNFLGVLDMMEEYLCYLFDV